MLLFILKRILLFIPTLLIISLVAFGLSRVPDTDPIENCYDPGGENESKANLEYSERIYAERASKLHVDKPVFYFALNARAYPDSLYRILRKSHRANLENLIAQYGNWSEIEAYFHQIRSTEIQILSAENPKGTILRSDVLREVRQLPISYLHESISNRLEKISDLSSQDSLFYAQTSNEIEKLQELYTAVRQNARPRLLYIPDFKWYGTDNQYHLWISGFLTGDLGLSCADQRPVGTKIKEALYWTLLMNILTIALSYGIAIPLGVQSALKKGSLTERIITVSLFVLYSLPIFWICTLTLIFFATPEYGMQIFPGAGLGDVAANASFWERFSTRAGRLILPVLCMTYPSFAFISRQMRGAMNETLKQDFIRTARAKGLPESQVIGKHALRNSLFPLITLFASVFPRVLAGSVVVEVIFNIPGMGKLGFDALLSEDWNLVFTVLMLTAVLTMIGILVADILYAKADPRVVV